MDDPIALPAQLRERDERAAELRARLAKVSAPLGRNRAWAKRGLNALALICAGFALWACGVLVETAFPGVGARIDAFTSPVTKEITARLGTFATCRQARAAGFHNIPRHTPAYARWLDADGDGVACEAKT